MIGLMFPDYPFSIEKRQNKIYIFDEIRRKWLFLTPEEWVRQHFVMYLVEHKKYPKSVFALEKTLEIAHTKQRFDVLIYKDVEPFCLVECKSFKVNLSSETIDQILRYYSVVQSPYIAITNGLELYVFKRTETGFTPLKELPNYRD